MKRRLKAVSRQRRRSLLARVVAGFGIGVGTIAHAWEPQDYTLRRGHIQKPAMTAADGGQARLSAFQGSGAQPRPSAPSQPRTQNFPGDSFLDDADGQDGLAAPLTDDEIGDVVGQAATPAPATPQFPAGGDLGGGNIPLSVGVFAGAYSAAPQMMGDFFGGGMVDASLVGATVALAGGDRRFKISENVSPAPQDRSYFNYNHFHNAVVDANGVNQSVDRFTFGVERRIFDGLASIEARLPFAATIDSTQVIGAPDTEAAELGNMAFALKLNLLSGRDWMLSGGTTLTIPTGDDYELFQGGVSQLLVQNEAVHMAPFLGFLTRPDRPWFAQGFIQADFDLNGNDVFTGSGFEGVFQDQNLLFLDASVGRWLRRARSPQARLSGLAAIAELHYTTTMNDTDEVAGVSNPFNRVDFLNATGALHFQFSEASLRVGGAAPLIDSDIRQYDAEVLVQYNRFF